MPLTACSTSQLHALVLSLRRGELTTVFEWAEQSQEALEKAGIDLRFQLHCYQMAQLAAEDEGASKAVK